MLEERDPTQAWPAASTMGDWLHAGQIKWQGEPVFVSEAMPREVVGLAETEHGDWCVRFMHVELGRIDRRSRRFTPAWHGRRVG